MKGEDKLSPALAAILEESEPNERHEAVVVLRAPKTVQPRLRGRLRVLSERLRFVEKQAIEQRATQDQVLDKIETAGTRRNPGREAPAVSTIGEGSLPVVTAEVTRRTLPDLLKQADVVAVLPNQRVELIEPRKVDAAQLAAEELKDGVTWGIRQLDIPNLWETTQGEDINVAVMDTGVHGAHFALAGRVREFVMIDPLARRIKVDPIFDSAQHGTHVCGTIAGGVTPDGIAIGVAPRASLFVANVINRGSGNLAMLLEGISWAIERGADIISMSLGFTYYEPLFALVFQEIIDTYGILPVVAIGNENHGNSSSPGNAYNALSVGAVERMPKGDLKVSAFSSGASLVFPGAEPNALVTKPDVVAPGAQVYSCIPPDKRPDGTREYTYMDGTSMATPHVAGVAALLMAARPEAPATDILQVLKETAAHPDGATARPDNRFGYGVVRPLEALKALT
ncbi:MAG TPA: S8 family serine peptidase [Chloroflexota bacterium]|nr:S8 family serine peptidase [Chloroflexota bacterium]